MRKSALTIAAALLSTGLLAGPAAAELDTLNLKVVGTWGNLSNWKEAEGPLWKETIPAASNGSITADAVPQTEVGIKGFEVMRLLKIGVFDVAHGVVGYIAGEDPVAEGIDLSGVIQNWDDAKAAAEAYRSTLAERFEQTYGAKLLAVYPFPSQMLWCNAEVNSTADLQGKKIRTYTTSMGDFAEGIGGTSVTIAFAEVVPALEKKVVDCGITGTMPAYQAKWWQVSTHAYLMSVGYTMTFAAMNLNKWNSLNDETKAFLQEQLASWEDRTWQQNIEEDQAGIDCNTDGPCPIGEPGGMKRVVPSEADDAERKRVLEEVVLKRYAERCGAECVENWNATIGKVAGVTAPMP